MHKKPLIVMVPGVNHGPVCFGPLADALRQLGWSDVLAFSPHVVPPADSSTLATAMAASLRYYDVDIEGRELVLISHSLGGACVAHLEEQLPQALVVAVCAIAPVGVAAAGARRTALNMLGAVGVRGTYSIFRTGNLPVASSGLRKLLYAPDMPEVEQVAAQEQLIYPDPRTLGFGKFGVGGSLYPARRSKRHPTLIIGYRGDLLVTADWLETAVAWWQPEALVEMEGAHNQFQTETGARLAAGLISGFLACLPASQPVEGDRE